MAARLHLAGVAFRPSWFHMAYAARKGFTFVEPARQGRFEALLRDTRDLPLLEVTHAVAEGRVRLNGEPYVWEPDEMAAAGPREEELEARNAVIAEARESSHFTLPPSSPRP
jgi:hypothetical protein